MGFRKIARDEALYKYNTAINELLKLCTLKKIKLCQNSIRTNKNYYTKNIFQKTNASQIFFVFLVVAVARLVVSI